MLVQDIHEFLRAEIPDRLRMARDPRNQALLEHYLGADAFREYRSLAQRLGDRHLSIDHVPNLIFVPGVMGSLLLSRSKGGVWWIDPRTRKHLNDLRLSSDGTADYDPSNDIAPFSTDPSYEPFLTAVLQCADFGHVLFPYDWRKPLIRSAAALRDLVVQTYAANGNAPVHLVAHSMGGLMVRTALMEHGDEMWPCIERIVFVGTPHYGSAAIAGYLKNHLWGFEMLAVLGLYLDRPTFRSLHGVLGLLPAPYGIYPGTRSNDPQPWHGGRSDDAYVHPCANFDLYDAQSWALDLSPAEAEHLGQVLEGAAALSKALHEAHHNLRQDLRDRMLIIAGVGYQTLFRLEYRSGFFGLWEHTVKVTSRVPGDLHREGDGRVPLASAMLEYVPMRYVRGIHGGLPNIPAVSAEIFRWLKGETLQLPETPQGALSRHLAAEDDRSDTPHLDGTALAADFTDDPGLWTETLPDARRIRELERLLDAEQLPEFARTRLL
jgi:pimeloyl-ACP methyl ester carboxylesterase